MDCCFYRISSLVGGAKLISFVILNTDVEDTEGYRNNGGGVKGV